MTLLRFWQSHAAEFASLFGQHVILVGIATLVATAFGVPLGILAARRPRTGAPIVWVANAAQTIPSLAMFGFLLPLPAWRSTAMLRAMGAVATATLGVGKVAMTGLTTNDLPFDANPHRIWRVDHATADRDRLVERRGRLGNWLFSRRRRRRRLRLIRSRFRRGSRLFWRRLRERDAAKANDGKSYDYPHETPL